MGHKLYLPESHRRAMNDEVSRDRAEIQAEYSLPGELAAWTRELRRLFDPNLKMVKAHERTAPESPLKAGYYHVLLESPGHPTTIMPVEHDDGSFRELGSHVFEMIEQNDMWNDRARRAGRERSRKLKEAADRTREREARARIDEFNERWASANRTQILVSRDV
jgi:hypothetical protein